VTNARFEIRHQASNNTLPASIFINGHAYCIFNLQALPMPFFCHGHRQAINTGCRTITDSWAAPFIKAQVDNSG
jgi:hypothetical protein